MKKILAMLLALTLVLGMSMTVMAEDNSWDNFDGFTKLFTTEGDGATPAAEFSFTVTDPTSYINNEGDEETADTIPTVTVGTAEFAEGENEADVSVSIAINDAPLGIYTYEITETDPNISGVSIADPFYLVVTILRDEDNTKHYVAAMHLGSATGSKDNKIENTYSSGSLTVTKSVSGNMADESEYFPFTVTFTPAEGDTIASSILVYFNGDTTASEAVSSLTEGTGEQYTKDGNTYTFYLKHDESIKFDNVPAGVTYEVSEEAGEYTESATNASGSIEGDKEAAFTNTLEATIDTGISMDSLPYIVIIAAVAVAAVIFFRKKRSSVEE